MGWLFGSKSSNPVNRADPLMIDAGHAPKRQTAPSTPRRPEFPEQKPAQLASQSAVRDRLEQPVVVPPSERFAVKEAPALQPQLSRKPASKPDPAPTAPPPGLGPRPKPVERLGDYRRKHVERYFSGDGSNVIWWIILVVAGLWVLSDFNNLYNMISFQLQYAPSFWDGLTNILEGMFLSWTTLSILISALIFVGALWQIMWKPGTMTDRQVSELMDHDLDWPSLRRRAVELSGHDPTVFQRAGFKEQCLWGLGDAFKTAWNEEFRGLREGADGQFRFTPLGVTVINATDRQLNVYNVDIDLRTGNWLHENSTELNLSDVVAITLVEDNETVADPRRSWPQFFYQLVTLKWVPYLLTFRWYWASAKAAMSPHVQLQPGNAVNGYLQVSTRRRIVLTSKDGRTVEARVPGKGPIRPGVPPMEAVEDSALAVTQALRKFVRDLKA